jgi:hypothetical protein
MQLHNVGSGLQDQNELTRPSWDAKFDEGQVGG